MPYEMKDEDEYCYPGTDVLINKLGITNKEELADAEKKIAYLRTIKLNEQIGENNFDFQRLKSIHQYIFQDLFDWAGVPRNIDIAKGESLFCLSRYIESSANDIFRRLQKENNLLGLPRTQFIERLAEYMGDINALHPFRDGNGRTQRQFFKELVRNAGFDIDFDKMNPQELLRADIAAMNGNSKPLVALLGIAVTAKPQ